MDADKRTSIAIGFVCLCVFVLAACSVLTIAVPIEVHEDSEIEQAVKWLNDGNSVKFIAVNGEELIIGNTTYHYKAVGDTIIEYCRDVPVKMINWNGYCYALYVA